LVISLKSKKIDLTLNGVVFKNWIFIECKDSKKILVFAILTGLIQNIKSNKKSFWKSSCKILTSPNLNILKSKLYS
jgi:hypothetical protein